MNRARRFWTFFKSLLARQETGEAIAMFRILVGVITISTLVDALMADAWRVVWVDQSDGGYRGFGGATWLVKFFGGATQSVIHKMIWASLIANVLVVIGFGGRITAFIALQTFLSLHRMNGEASGSSDELITNGLWLLVLANSTATWSVDSILRAGKLSSDALVSSWPRYLGVLQVLMTYSMTGIQKISVYWLPFGELSALYYVLQQPSFIRYAPDYLTSIYWVTQFGTLTTWLWEVLSPVVVYFAWCRETMDRGGRARAFFQKVDMRVVWAVVGVGFHMTILLTMSVGPFSLITMAYYPCYFSPDEYRRAYRRVRAFMTSSSTSAPAG